jgi:hypothetical protein
MIQLKAEGFILGIFPHKTDIPRDDFAEISVLTHDIYDAASRTYLNPATVPPLSPHEIHAPSDPSAISKRPHQSDLQVRAFVASL